MLNANYMKKVLESYYPVTYVSKEACLCAHEFILDIRQWKANGIEAEDIAKRLMDYGFHAPTMSFPIPGTLMVEPTESELKEELDRFCEAMITIRQEIQQVLDGKVDKKNNVLTHAPHTAAVVSQDEQDRPYSRSQAAYPVDGLRNFKCWLSV